MPEAYSFFRPLLAADKHWAALECYVADPSQIEASELATRFVDAGTALSWGLVNEVLPPAGLMPRARALAAQIAETDRSTMERIRDLISTGTEHGLSDSLAREVEVFQRHIAGVSSSDVAEGRARVTERGRQINR